LYVKHYTRRVFGTVEDGVRVTDLKLIPVRVMVFIGQGALARRCVIGNGALVDVRRPCLSVYTQITQESESVFGRKMTRQQWVQGSRADRLRSFIMKKPGELGSGLI
jgi:hypothetical protein